MNGEGYTGDLPAGTAYTAEDLVEHARRAGGPADAEGTGVEAGDVWRWEPVFKCGGKCKRERGKGACGNRDMMRACLSRVRAEGFATNGRVNKAYNGEQSAYRVKAEPD